MFNKLFGGKKSDSFYAELKETEGSQAEVSVQPVEAASAQEESPIEAVEETVEPIPAPKSKKKSGKKNAKTEVIVAPQPKAPPTPEELIKAAVTRTNSNGNTETKTVAFASEYLITDTLSRRRPGPSLNVFKEMARQVNPKG